MRYIHIGTLKTGSTAIQSFMETHAERLSARGILYPEAARHGRHKHLYLKQELRKSHGEGGPDWAALHAELGASAHAKVLLSDEGFALLDDADVKHFHRLLGPGDTTVVAYFRDYASWLPSLYAEYTKNGRNLVDFDTYFEQAMARPSQAQVIAQWAEAFGWEHVRVRLFATDRLVNGDVVDDLLHLLGTSRALLEVGPDQPVRAALGWEALEIARAVLTDVAGTPGATVDERIPLFVRGACMRAVAEAAPAGRTKVEYLSADQRRRCDEQTAADLAFLNQHLPGAALALLVKPAAERPFLPSVEHVPSVTVAAAMARLAVLLAAQVPDGTVERKRRVERKAAAAARAADDGAKEARRQRKKAKKQAETPEQRSDRKSRKPSKTSRTSA